VGTARHGPRRIAVYPPLFSAELAADVAATARRPVPFDELLALQDDFAEQLAHVPADAKFEFKVED
jgi:hypothetical protein